MGKKEIIALLREYKNNFTEKYGIGSLGFFGSMARGEAREDSDLDIVVTIEKPDLVVLSRIRIEIEEMIHRHVDIVHYRKNMNKFLKDRIDREAVYV
ncbi:MAG: nucleotidyltransferase domain-containing protein [Candidatus Wallbacteria bacterium]|nr:nucleotidyltransferase domain-containing protein [Candidatus Wallbacteria bacterium]